MELLLIRHAIAEEVDLVRWPDDRGRPLTKEGEARFRAIARVLARISDAPEEIWSSPLKRTWQTAEILQHVCGWPAPQATPSLEPGHDPGQIMSALRSATASSRLALVGHEPTLHELLAFMLGGAASHVALEVKKGGVALVRFETALRAGKGQLLYLLPPRVLLAMAED